MRISVEERVFVASCFIGVIGTLLTVVAFLVWGQLGNLREDVKDMKNSVITLNVTMGIVSEKQTNQQGAIEELKEFDRKSDERIRSLERARVN